MAIEKRIDGKMVKKEDRGKRKGRETWVVRVYAGVEGGKRKFITKTFTRETDAIAYESELKTQKYNEGELTAPSKEPFGKFLDYYLDEVKKGQIRPRTLEDYRGLIRRYIKGEAARIRRVERKGAVRWVARVHVGNRKYVTKVFEQEVDAQDFARAQTPRRAARNLGAVPLSKLNGRDFEKLYTHLWEVEGLHPRSLQYLHQVVGGALRYALAEGKIRKYPLKNVKPKKKLQDGTKPKRAVRAMTKEEAEKFLDAAKGDRYYALWLLLMTSGLRPSEACGLTWDDILWTANKVHVRRSLTRRGVNGWQLSDPKSEDSERKVDVPPITIKALQAWKAVQARERLQLGGEWRGNLHGSDEPHGLVFTTPFGSPLSLVNLSCRNFRRLLEAAELGTFTGEGRKRKFKPKFRLYDTRHSHASLLLAMGENIKVISKRLGHADEQITMSTYLHLYPEQREAAATKMQELFGAVAG